MDLAAKRIFYVILLLSAGIGIPGYFVYDFITAFLAEAMVRPHSEEAIAQFIYAFNLIFAGWLIVLVILFVMIILMVRNIYKKPINHLNEAITKMDADNFDFKVNYNKRDEFTDTFSKLNRTIEKVSFLKEDYKKSEKRIVSLLKAVDESILVVDTRKHVSSFNDATYRMFRSDKRNFPEKFARILNTNRELNDHLTQVLKTDTRVKEKEVTVFMSDDTELLLKMNIQPLKEEDVLHGAVLTFKDLNLVHELENNLLRSMKFGVITNLASSISHEIKNPLSAMALHAEILEGRIKKLDMEGKSQVLQSVQTLQSESARLSRIIEQFLTLARPTKPELNLIDMNKIIAEVIILVRQQAQENNINLSSELDSGIGIIYGDEDQLKQVVLNILLNAFAALTNGGDVEVKSRAEYEKVIISIRDTGIGISESIQKKIFDLYFTTKKDGGGVGLAICKNIVTAHDGKLFYETNEGKGTTFFISLPTKDPTTIRSTRIKPIRKS